MEQCLFFHYVRVYRVVGLTTSLILSVYYTPTCRLVLRITVLLSWTGQGQPGGSRPSAMWPHMPPWWLLYTPSFGFGFIYKWRSQTVKCKCHYLCLPKHWATTLISCLNNGLVLQHTCTVVHETTNSENKLVIREGGPTSVSIQTMIHSVLLKHLLQVSIVVIFISDSNTGVICWVNQCTDLSYK